MNDCAPAVTFNFDTWIARYPEFAAVDPTQAQGFFDTATLFCHNRLGPVRKVETLAQLLYMLTSHIAILSGAGIGNTGPSTNRPVGRISGATEGSVSAQFENQYPPGTAQWYQQTGPGSMFWAATAIYRTFRYKRARWGINQPTPWVYPNGGNWAG